jgi:hypothetical protein
MYNDKFDLSYNFYDCGAENVFEAISADFGRLALKCVWEKLDFTEFCQLCKERTTVLWTQFHGYSFRYSTNNRLEIHNFKMKADHVNKRYLWDKALKLVEKRRKNLIYTNPENFIPWTDEQRKNSLKSRLTDKTIFFREMTMSYRFDKMPLERAFQDAKMTIASHEFTWKKKPVKDSTFNSWLREWKKANDIEVSHGGKRKNAGKKAKK